MLQEVKAFQSEYYKQLWICAKAASAPHTMPSLAQIEEFFVINISLAPALKSVLQSTVGQYDVKPSKLFLVRMTESS